MAQEPIHEQREGLEVHDDDKANRYLRRIAFWKREKERVKEAAKVARERNQTWSWLRNKIIDSKVEFWSMWLKDYLDTTGRTSLPLPDGTIRYRKKTGQLEIEDEAKVGEWARGEDLFERFKEVLCGETEIDVAEVGYEGLCELVEEMKIDLWERLDCCKLSPGVAALRNRLKATGDVPPGCDIAKDTKSFQVQTGVVEPDELLPDEVDLDDLDTMAGNALAAIALGVPQEEAADAAVQGAYVSEDVADATDTTDS